MEEERERGGGGEQGGREGERRTEREKERWGVGRNWGRGERQIDRERQGQRGDANCHLQCAGYPSRKSLKRLQ